MEMIERLNKKIQDKAEYFFNCTLRKVCNQAAANTLLKDVFFTLDKKEISLFETDESGWPVLAHEIEKYTNLSELKKQMIDKYINRCVEFLMWEIDKFDEKI